MAIHSYKEFIVWQRAMELVVAVYSLTEKFPLDERYGLTAQLRRSAVSVPCNIAEGRHRGTRKDFVQFLRFAYSSGAELETQIEISKRLPITGHCKYSTVDALLEEVMKMLNAMLLKLKT
jgi:four helix bundle protein